MLFLYFIHGVLVRWWRAFTHTHSAHAAAHFRWRELFWRDVVRCCACSSFHFAHTNNREFAAATASSSSAHCVRSGVRHVRACAFVRRRRRQRESSSRRRRPLGRKHIWQTCGCAEFFSVLFFCCIGTCAPQNPPKLIRHLYATRTSRVRCWWCVECVAEVEGGLLSISVPLARLLNASNYVRTGFFGGGEQACMICVLR